MDTVEELTMMIDMAGDNAPADLYYRRGRAYWKIGDKGRAMSDYSRAAALDPASPAVEALELCRQIMDFYNTDLYNP